MRHASRVVMRDACRVSVVVTLASCRWRWCQTVQCLIDGEKYFQPDDLPPPAGEELRPWRRPRAPSLRHMVKLALECDSAEAKGRDLRRRLDCLDPAQRRERARVLVDGGMSQSDAARILRVGRSTICRDLADNPARDATPSLVAAAAAPSG
jgi:hypothetical protein